MVTSQPGKRRTQAERRAASERRVLGAAAELIAEEGTSNVSFADIARRAGCSHGLPGYLFGSKTNLLLALVEEMLTLFRTRALAPVLESHPDRQGLDAVVQVMEVYLNSLTDPWPRTRALYVLIGEAQGGPPELRAALSSHHEAARGLLRDMLVEARDRGDLKPDVDPEAQSVILLGQLRGIGAQILLDPGAVDLDSVIRELVASTRRALAP